MNYVSGNLLDSKADVLINAVNCQGVMGKGLALAFKNKYPRMFQEYREVCKQGRLGPGRYHLYQAGDQVIINFVTKIRWREPSQLEWIEKGLNTLRGFLDGLAQATGSYPSVAIPPLGCGYGGLNWSQVESLVKKYLGDYKGDVSVYFYSSRSKSTV